MRKWGNGVVALVFLVYIFVPGLPWFLRLALAVGAFLTAEAAYKGFRGDDDPWA